MTVSAYICLNSAYPRVPPLVKLDQPHRAQEEEVHFSPYYQSMERSILAAVNTIGVTPSTIAACKSDLIVTQLRYLQVCFSILFLDDC